MQLQGGTIRIKNFMLDEDKGNLVQDLWTDITTKTMS